MSAFPDRLDRGAPYPLGATWDGLGTNFAVFSAHAERIELCLFDPTGRREIARFELPECTDEIWHGYLPNARPGLDLRLSRPRTVQSAGRPPLQSAQAAARSLCAALRRRAALVRRAVRLSHQFAARRSVVRSARQRAGHAESGGQRRHVRLGRRPAARTFRGRGRSSTKRMCAA